MTRSIQQQPNPILRAAFPLLLVFLFSVFSAVMELLPYIRIVRPILIIGTLGLLAVFGTGQFVKVLSTPTGKCVAIFTIWFIACIPFAVWSGGSVTVFTDFWYKAALTFLLTAGLLTTLPQAKRLFHAIAYAVGLMATMAVLLNARQMGRLMLDNSRYANANELAWTLLTGLTMLGYLYISGNRFQKAIALTLSLPVLLALSRTGSREGSVGVVMLCIVVFLQVSKRTRIKLAVGLPVALLLLLMALPAELRMRYTTYFGDVSATEYGSWQMATIGSAEARLTLLKDSLRLTVIHPLFGVGPGNFPVAQDLLAQARGEKSAWKVTHNTYTQVSSEMGLPGLIIYLTLLFQIFKALRSIIRTKSRSPAWVELRMLALTLRTAMVVLTVVAFFGSVAYNTDIPILAGMTVALGFLSQKQRAIDRTASAKVVATEPFLEPALQPVTVGQY